MISGKVHVVFLSWVVLLAEVVILLCSGMIFMLQSFWTWLLALVFALFFLEG